MVAHHGTHELASENREWTSPPRTGLFVAIGLVALVAAFFLARGSQDGVRRFWFAYVVNFAFFFTFTMGALFFVNLSHLTRSGWNVVVRRPAEALACNIGLLAILFLPILGVVLSNSGILYHWAQPAIAHSSTAGHTAADATQPSQWDAHATGGEQKHAHDAAHADEHAHGAAAAHGHGHGLDDLILKKRAFLNPTFFAIRWAVMFAIWVGLAVYLWRQSVRQDLVGGTEIHVAVQKVAAPGMVLFALTFTLAAFDLVMSLDAHWFSTMFGVYFFAGGMVSFFSLLIVIIRLLQRQGLIASSVTVEHYHDMGKFLFAFVFFWGYIAFSQYMLIWYGNLPEETGWLLRRGMGVGQGLSNTWSPIILVILFGHFLLPFPGLLSRHVKRNKKALTCWAVWLLAIHWIDMYWLVMPEMTTTHLPIAVELLCLVGMGSLYYAGARVMLAAGRNLIPVRDPRLGESLAFHNA